jgi:hypothetical protein
MNLTFLKKKKTLFKYFLMTTRDQTIFSSMRKFNNSIQRANKLKKRKFLNS